MPVPSMSSPVYRYAALGVLAISLVSVSVRWLHKTLQVDLSREPWLR